MKQTENTIFEYNRLMLTECRFCKLGKEPGNIYENSLFFSIFDEFPVSPGHALVIPKRHVEDIDNLEPYEWALLQDTLRQVIKIIQTTDFRATYATMLQNPLSPISAWFCHQALAHPRLGSRPDSYNHGVNDGKAAGRTVDHFHWHIIPRYDGDMQDPRGGIRYVIPEMGNYKIRR